jgi:hypothetical protein
MDTATPTFDVNNVDSVIAAMQPTTVIEDGWTDDEVLQTTITLIKEDKTTAEIKAALDESYEGIPDVDGLIEKALGIVREEEFDAEQAAEIDPRDKIIRDLKEEGESVLEGLDEDFADVELPEVDQCADLDEQIRVLKVRLHLLYAAKEVIPSDPGTFGKFNGICTPLRFMEKGKGDKEYIATAWVDVDGVDVYTGLQFDTKLPWIQEQIDAWRKRKAEDWREAEEAKKEAAKVYEGDEYPVRILPPQPGPVWNDKILYGIAGDIVRKISATCESHPAGMLVDFLVSFGNMIGRGPYFNINETEHFPNEFFIRVGDSSKSRKGTGRDVIDKVLEQIDHKWFTERVTSGFGSSEAIINQIRDSSMETRQVKVKGVVASEQYQNRGVDDKRLYIRDGEIVGLFVLADKKESLASALVRNLWDGKPVRNIVKGKTVEGLSNSAKCERPHVSISGDTTIHELRARMPKGSDENGFANRFLFVYVYRTKECPNGGPTLDWSKEVVQLGETLQRARTVKHVSMTGAARKWCFDNYHDLEYEGPSGLAGKMTARGPAHVRRLAMIYALLDRSDQIDTRHFQAAKRLWDYCSESAVFIFGGATSEQRIIRDWIELRGMATYKQIRDDLFHRNKPVREIKAALVEMVSKKLLRLVGDIYTKVGG